jgi:hypothetical protein
MKYALTISTAMRNVALVATATALVVAPVFAQECKMTLGEGQAVLVGPDGTSAARLAAIPAGESPANRGVQTLL